MTADSEDDDAAVIGSPVRQDSASNKRNNPDTGDLMFQTEVDVTGGPSKYENDVTPKKKSVKKLVSEYRSKIVGDPVFKPLI
jgi:hypothetical protein